MTPVDVNLDRQRWYWTLNAVFLLACVSMYFGTGWSLVLFSFPIAPKLTTATYYMQFVPQVEAATQFFTYMTMAMLASAALMIIAEWRTGYAWVPVIVLLLVIAATWLTKQYIFPLNHEMSAGITTQARLDEVLGKWMRLNTIRVMLWTVQWVTISSYFGLKAARAPRAL
ncbi:MAG: hypothetical protein ABI625_05640 [bacterium]